LCKYKVAYTKDEWPYLIGPDGIICSGVYHFNMEEDLWKDFTPDYLKDLNACHAFEKLIISEDQQDGYIDHLEYICSGLRWDFATATAAQRCKAFVLTMTERS